MGKELNLIKIYISNRSQTVRIKSEWSKPIQMHYGVPEGSILGRLLFLFKLMIYITEIQRVQTLNYADDISFMKNHGELYLWMLENVWIKINTGSTFTA